MCKKKQFKYCPSEIDPCMRNLIKYLNESSNHFQTVACCCGHGKYNMTILVKLQSGEIFDLLSDKVIPRTRNFYKKDKQGYYYIPEVVKKQKLNKN